LRSEILKEGKLIVRQQIANAHLNPQYFSILFPPPLNSTGNFFVADKFGGCGWEVYLPDGTIGKKYVEWPPEWGKITLYFPDAPKEHLGKQITDDSVQSLIRLYLDYLENIVKEAKEKFG
jgi:hypothetical protein